MRLPRKDARVGRRRVWMRTGTGYRAWIGILQLTSLSEPPLVHGGNGGIKTRLILPRRVCVDFSAGLDARNYEELLTRCTRWKQRRATSRRVVPLTLFLRAV